MEAFHTLFGGRAPGRFAKLPPELEVLARRLRDVGRRVSFALQATQEGFGHAVYAAHEAVGHEPFLLMLGDHLYRSRNSRSCARQLLDTYEREGCSVLGLRPVAEDQVRHYGIASGTWQEEGRLLHIETLVEKPSVELARAALRTPGLPPGEYMAFFGQYAVRPELFDYLADEISNGQRERGEFQLTPALDRLRCEHGSLGLLLEGDCYDIGLPRAYVHTLQAFAQ